MAQKITHYTVGSVWQPQATFTVGSTATDPTTLTVLQQNAAGVETTISAAVSPAGLNASSTPVAKPSTGVFKLNPGTTLDASGYWFVKFIGTGAAAATKQEEVIVDPDEFTSNAGLSDRALVTLAETKDWLNQQNIDPTEDLELVRVINDVSDRIHQEAGREFKPNGTNPQTRQFTVDFCTRVLELGDSDLATLSTSSPITMTAYDWSTTAITFTTADARGLPLIRKPWEPITRLELRQNAGGYFMPGYTINITGNWGFPAVPGNIRQAALDAIAYVVDRDVEHWRQDLAAVSTGEVTLMLSLPPAAQDAANSYNKLFVG